MSERHPAQPDNLPLDDVVKMLAENINVLVVVSNTLGNTKPSRAMKDMVRQNLAGVCADLETIRLGLK